ncbi:hypothetical protein L3X38_011485 [Prunus dulcis]|uniref:Uncharacterized protein n=1 Tax=Prunus dulcis TaxID=3755 RepID=A0AAD4WJ63_PRUDU|nr:hypothetical protein L3X38_011485 [Prunus dulcis]
MNLVHSGELRVVLILTCRSGYASDRDTVSMSSIGRVYGVTASSLSGQNIIRPCTQLVPSNLADTSIREEFEEKHVWREHVLHSRERRSADDNRSTRGGADDKRELDTSDGFDDITREAQKGVISVLRCCGSMPKNALVKSTLTELPVSMRIRPTSKSVTSIQMIIESEWGKMMPFSSSSEKMMGSQLIRRILSFCPPAMLRT